MSNETVELTKEELIDLVKDMDSGEILQLNNLFCESANYSDNYIYNFDEDFLEEIFTGSKDDLARAIFYGNFNYSHGFIFFNGYGNLETKSYLDYKCLPDYLDNIVQYILNNYSDFEELF